MKYLALTAMAFLAFQSLAQTQDTSLTDLATSEASSSKLKGIWILRIDDKDHQPVHNITIQFENEKADSCIGGDWKKITTITSQTLRKEIFPVTDELSYQVTTNGIVIGSNSVCDSYLRFEGKFDGLAASGDYYSFWMNGSKELGYFHLFRKNP